VSAELLLVDLDGTLVDSFEDIQQGMTVALDAIGVPATAELLALSRRGVSLEVYYRHALARDPADPGEHARFRRFVDTYVGHYEAHPHTARVYDGVHETLAELGRRRPGLRMGVATNKRTDLARDLLARAGLARFFDVIQGSEAVAKKPDPAILLLIARQLGVDIRRAIMVGDSGADVQAAQSAGCGAVAVTYGGWPRHEIEALRPDHLIDRFSELLDIVGA
jgi:2-phosphoglycolate phosphatase